jgi:hypothetical protein
MGGIFVTFVLMEKWVLSECTLLVLTVAFVF